MEDEREQLARIDRREARSGRLSYGDPVILHETSRRRVVMVPFFIRRSSGTNLAIKLQTYLKAAPPMQDVLIEEKSLSLDEAASRRLLKALRDHLAIAHEAADGSYLLIRVSEGTAQLGEHDPAAVAAALAKVLSQEEILQHLEETELSDELVNAFRGAIRLKDMRSAVSQLRQHLDSGENDESVYQAWCEQHSWAFGNAYVVRDDVREISPGDHLDILLPSVISGYRDIVELKRPDMQIIRYDEPHRNWYFSADVSRAVGQCHQYLDVLQEVAAKGLRDHPEIVAYHPRAIIVLGRSVRWSEEQLRALHGLNSRLTGITVMSYDQLLLQGQRLVEILSSSTPEPSTEDRPVNAAEWDDEEVPW